jgi:hypothetical protein
MHVPAIKCVATRELGAHREACCDTSPQAKAKCTPRLAFLADPFEGDVGELDEDAGARVQALEEALLGGKCERRTLSNARPADERSLPRIESERQGIIHGSTIENGLRVYPYRSQASR